MFIGRKGEKIRLGTLNVGTFKSRDLANMMESGKMDVLRVQQTRWKGNKACRLGADSSCFMVVWMEMGRD